MVTKDFIFQKVLYLLPPSLLPDLELLLLDDLLLSLRVLLLFELLLRLELCTDDWRLLFSDFD